MTMRRTLNRPSAAYWALLAAFVKTALGSPVKPDPVAGLLPRQTIIPGGKPCGQHNATNRACWKNNWNINTDYEVTTPPAFNTHEVRGCPLPLRMLQLNDVQFDFHITNVTNWLGPDGVRKSAMLINGVTPWISMLGTTRQLLTVGTDQFPGPTLTVDWGDYIIINVHNDMQDNG